MITRRTNGNKKQICIQICALKWYLSRCEPYIGEKKVNNAQANQADAGGARLSGFAGESPPARKPGRGRLATPNIRMFYFRNQMS